jgi:predicted ATP-binding protein involved in virulence
MYITNIHIENIRCFEKITIPFEHQGILYRWGVLLGNNSTGKTCLLRCIAIGLCDELSGAGLIKELKGDFLRDNTQPGIIEITLKEYKSNHEYIIQTTIIREHDDDKISQLIKKGDRENFRKKLFVCGYGIQRSGEGTESYDKYEPISAVFTLFNYYMSSLQNPEVILLRQHRDDRESLYKLAKTILMLDDRYDFDLTKKGLEIIGPEGRVSIHSWGDGYRSLFTWTMDFIGWQIYADNLNDFKNLKDLRGIVLIDEAELNLHPNLQRYFVKIFKEQFPKVQFIITSHSPIVAAGASDFDDSKFVALIHEGNKVTDKQYVSSDIRGKRFDQVLMSEAFGLYTVKSPGSVSNISRYIELKNKDRDNAENTEFNQLTDNLKKELPSGDTKEEQVAKKAFSEALKIILADQKEKFVKEGIDMEMKKILKDYLE